MNQPSIRTRFSGTFIGFVFSLCCFFGTWTIALPLLTILPIGIIETFYSDSHTNYAATGSTTIWLLWGLLIVSTLLFYGFIIFRIKRGEPVKSTKLIVFLIVQLFLVHPLFFYVKTSENWEQATDGQFIFGILETFPFSSIPFVFFGVVFDVIRRVVKPRMVVDEKNPKA